jgi:hypothetical protein
MDWKEVGIVWMRTYVDIALNTALMGVVISHDGGSVSSAV